MRLIDADELIKATQHAGFIRRSEIEAAPTVDAEPVRHGRWLEKHPTYASAQKSRMSVCSACGATKGRKSWPYCPYCGARMDGDDVAR